MVDKINPIKLNKHRLSKYKGTVLLELTDKRGNKEIRKGENTFLADNLAWYLDDNGAYNNSPWSASSMRNSPVDTLLGGVLLFDTPIEPDENNNYPLFMPAGVKMKACSSTLAKLSTDAPERGTFNSQESSKTASVITYVHDWATSEGNGVINAISLTSRVGGAIGYGYGSGFWRSSGISMGSDQSYTGSAVPSALGSITVSDYDWCQTKDNVYGMSNSYYNRLERLTYEVDNEVDIFRNINTHERTNPTVPINTTYRKGTSDGVYVFMQNSLNISGGSSKTVYFFNPDTGASSNISLTNPYSYGMTFVNKIDDVLYFYGNSSSNYDKFVWYDITNSTWGVATGPSNLTSSGGYEYAVPLGEGLVVYMTKYTSYWSIIVDTVNETAYPTCMTLPLTERWNSKDKGIIMGSRTQYDYFTGVKCPLYLGTVYNLDSPVTKDASNSMKLTYTLTKVVE